MHFADSLQLKRTFTLFNRRTFLSLWWRFLREFTLGILNKNYLLILDFHRIITNFKSNFQKKSKLKTRKIFEKKTMQITDMQLTWTYTSAFLLRLCWKGEMCTLRVYFCSLHSPNLQVIIVIVSLFIVNRISKRI